MNASFVSLSLDICRERLSIMASVLGSIWPDPALTSLLMTAMSGP